MLIRILSTLALCSMLIACTPVQNPAGRSIHTDGEFLVEGTDSAYRWSAGDDMTFRSVQPHSTSDQSTWGSVSVAPGPANMQMLRLIGLGGFTSTNPAATTIKDFEATFTGAAVPVRAIDANGDEIELDVLALSSVKFAEYSSDAPAAITAEAGRLEVLVPFLETATQAQLEAYVAEVQARLALGQSITDALVKAAELAAPIPEVP